MAKARVVIATVVIGAGWLLAFAEYLRGWRLGLVAATIAWALLVWAELDRHAQVDANASLRDRIALITDLGDRTFPRWYPEERIQRFADGELELILNPLRTSTLGSGSARCTVEDPDGIVTFAIREMAIPLDPGDAILMVRYPRDFEDARPIKDGLYRVLWEDNAPGVDRPVLCSYAFEVPE
jgi:hypothetical protein